MESATPSHGEFYAETDSPARLNPNFREAALGHASTLHPESGRGNVVLARKDEGRWDQRSYPIAELPEVIPLYAGQPDSYITQQRYAFRRTVSQLVELSGDVRGVGFLQRAGASRDGCAGSPRRHFDPPRRRADPLPVIGYLFGERAAFDMAAFPGSP